jgi:hypothetical protein
MCATVRLQCGIAGQVGDPDHRFTAKPLAEQTVLCCIRVHRSPSQIPGTEQHYIQSCGTRRDDMRRAVWVAYRPDTAPRRRGLGQPSIPRSAGRRGRRDGLAQPRPQTPLRDPQHLILGQLIGSLDHNQAPILPADCTKCHRTLAQQVFHRRRDVRSCSDYLIPGELSDIPVQPLLAFPPHCSR